jgi:hypothetical protein
MQSKSRHLQCSTSLPSSVRRLQVFSRFKQAPTIFQGPIVPISLLGLNEDATTLPFDAPDHPLGTTNDVSTLLADSINQLRRGQLDPRVANAMGYLATVLLRALEQGPLEERLTKIEELLG